MTQHLGSRTMQDFFGERYGSKALKVTASVIVFVFLIPYTASLYNGLSRLFGMAFDVPYAVCVVLMATLTGVYVILTGVDTVGKQCHEFGSSEGNLKEQLVLNRAGTPGDDDYIISFDVTLKEGMGQERPGPTAAHRACDKFIQTYRDKMKKFKGEKCTERHEYHDIVRPGKKRVLIVKQVAGQGAMYDTHLFAKEPSGVEGGRSIIDMGNMPILVTPNEYRDGIIRSMQ